VAVRIYGPGDVWVDDFTADYIDEKETDPVSFRMALTGHFVSTQTSSAGRPCRNPEKPVS
jgi:hypothetical protein